MDLKIALENYLPCCEQEACDRRIMLDCLQNRPDALTRRDELAHFTASAWVVNPARTKVLMLYHNIYRSWSWPGGHADGDADLLAVATREVREETGVLNLRPASEALFSLETLTVNAHFKHGKFVSSHLHMNLTYLLEADDQQPLQAKPDENSAVQWFGLEEAVAASTEADMQIIYRKLNQKLMDADRAPFRIQ